LTHTDKSSNNCANYWDCYKYSRWKNYYILEKNWYAREPITTEFK